ncbi:hypothetical protein [Eubacterium callanderi]|uniref:hypothetical protein n=1 Tax=Eubacterium callanderi TaxID=53442 RepID=UPI0039944F8D
MKNKTEKTTLEKIPSKKTFERCILCGKQTYIQINAPITARQGYIEGVGQLCARCNRKIKTSN